MQVESWGLNIFHWFRENPVENILVKHFMSIFWPNHGYCLGE